MTRTNPSATEYGLAVVVGLALSVFVVYPALDRAGLRRSTPVPALPDSVRVCGAGPALFGTPDARRKVPVALAGDDRNHANAGLRTQVKLVGKGVTGPGETGHIALIEEPRQAPAAPPARPAAAMDLPRERTAPGASASRGIFRVTSYCPCKVCCGPNAKGITKSGAKVRVGLVAADWRVLPRGTALRVPGYGLCEVADTGSAIRGNRIDVFLPTHQEAKKYGVKYLNVEIVSKGALR